MARRVVVICGAPGQGVDSRIRAIASATPSAKIILDPRENPVVGAVIAEGRNPAIQHWKGNDGSFCIIDGEVFNLRDIAADAVENPARAVFNLVTRQRSSGLVKLDAAAAIIIWDARHGELTVVRDQTGSAPAFTATHQGCFYFASDLFSLVEAGVDRTLDLRALDYFMGHGFAPAPWTYIESVSKIPAAHAIRVQPGQAPRLLRYDAEFHPWKKTPRRAEGLGILKQRLVRAIERRCPPHGTTGVLLSGEFKSALLLAIVSRMCNAPTEAFSFRYGAHDAPSNESEEAAKIAHYFGVRHHVIECTPHDLSDNVGALVSDHGEPFTYGLQGSLLGEVKSRGISTVLSSIGSDGYDVDGSGLASIYFDKLPAFVRQSARLGMRLMRPFARPMDRRTNPVFWSDETGFPVAFYPANMQDEERRDLYSDKSWFDRAQHETSLLLNQTVAHCWGRSEVDICRSLNHSGFDAECTLFQNTAWARRFDMAVRYPFFDVELKDYMMHASPGGKGSHLFREIAATLMPMETPKGPKPSQTNPLGHWLRGPLREMMLDHLQPSRVADLFDPRFILILIDEHLRGAVDHTWRLWSLISYVAWREQIASIRVARPGTVSAPASAGS